MFVQYCYYLFFLFQIFSESKDDLALILFGSSQTNNPFSSQGSCFKNIEIVTSLGQVTWDLLRHITNISSTDITSSDWLSTLVVATDMLKNENEYVCYTIINKDKNFICTNRKKYKYYMHGTI